jgi:hypothetical protein
MRVFSPQLDAILENHKDTKWTRYSISMSKTQFWKKGSLGARVILQSGHLYHTKFASLKVPWIDDVSSNLSSSSSCSYFTKCVFHTFLMLDCSVCFGVVRAVHQRLNCSNQPTHSSAIMNDKMTLSERWVVSHPWLFDQRTWQPHHHHHCRTHNLIHDVAYVDCSSCCFDCIWSQLSEGDQIWSWLFVGKQQLVSSAVLLASNRRHSCSNVRWSTSVIPSLLLSLIFAWISCHSKVCFIYVWSWGFQL